ncbi:MAG: NAD(+) synthase [Firmicutes bacterium]|nr:NAD(+) synthase [Bacillota bacterium]
MFDPKKVKNNIVEWIREWFENNGPGCNGIVAVSGGKDSSVVAALLVEALGKDRVIGVLLPRGVQPDIDMSYALVNHLGIKYYEINIGETMDALIKEMQTVMGEDAVSKQTIVNLPPRIRMAATYAVSQSLNGRVANTCNLSEDWVGYATRYGDNAGDFSPLSKLTVQEVKAIGRELGLPEFLVEKVPSDGLQEKTDEDNLGFTYAVLDRYIREGVIEDQKTKERIDHLHKINAFKLKYMDCFEYVPE